MSMSTKREAQARWCDESDSDDAAVSSEYVLAFGYNLSLNTADMKVWAGRKSLHSRLGLDQQEWPAPPFKDLVYVDHCAVGISSDPRCANANIIADVMTMTVLLLNRLSEPWEAELEVLVYRID